MAIRRIKRRAFRRGARARLQAFRNPSAGTFKNPGFFSPGLPAHGLLPPRYVRAR